jgi:pimeloyl-ACP methyl ester carboxylesterase
MQTEETQFYSDGLKLGASFYWPDDFDAATPRPMVIACSGFTGLRHIHPARFARYLTRHGQPCFSFDYRGFADSQGARYRVLFEEQVRDIIHAVAYVGGDERVDASRLILLGWGMGAGMVLDAARHLPGIVGLIAVNGSYDGPRVQLYHRGEAAYRDFCLRVHEERRRRAQSGIADEADPFEIYPLDPLSRDYVDAVLRRTPGYQAERYSFELADSLLRWVPEAYADRMHIPLLLAHGERNELHPTTEAVALYRVYGGPKEMFWIENAGHTEFMHDDDARFQALGAHIVEWVEARLHKTKVA